MVWELRKGMRQKKDDVAVVARVEVDGCGCVDGLRVGCLMG